MFTRENNYLSEQLFLEHTGATFSELLRHDLWKVNGKGAVEARNVFRTLSKISDVNCYCKKLLLRCLPGFSGLILESGHACGLKKKGQESPVKEVNYDFFRAFGMLHCSK